MITQNRAGRHLILLAAGAFLLILTHVASAIVALRRQSRLLRPCTAVWLPRGVQIYGHLNNLLNEKYEESFGYPALRLNFVSGIRFNFPAESSGASR